VTREELLEQVKGLSDDEAARARIVVVPEADEPTLAEVRERLGTRPTSPEELDAFWAEYGPQMQPADGEG
jgi:hypothetical protein